MDRLELEEVSISWLWHMILFLIRDILLNWLYPMKCCQKVLLDMDLFGNTFELERKCHISSVEFHWVLQTEHLRPIAEWASAAQPLGIEHRKVDPRWGDVWIPNPIDTIKTGLKDNNLKRLVASLTSTIQVWQYRLLQSVLAAGRNWGYPNFNHLGICCLLLWMKTRQPPESHSMFRPRKYDCQLQICEKPVKMATFARWCIFIKHCFLPKHRCFLFVVSGCFRNFQDYASDGSDAIGFIQQLGRQGPVVWLVDIWWFQTSVIFILNFGEVIQFRPCSAGLKRPVEENGNF